MQSWMYGLIAIPVVAVGAAYAMGAFSTDISSLNKKLGPDYSSSAFAKDPTAMQNEIDSEKMAFRGDDEFSSYQTAGRKRKHKKTKKSKSKHKKTKRHSK